MMSATVSVSVFYFSEVLSFILCTDAVNLASGQRRRQDLERGLAQNPMKPFAAYKITRNTRRFMYPLTKLPQLLTQNTLYVWRGNRTKSLSDLVHL